TIREEIERSFDGTYDNTVLQEIHDRWMKSFKRTFRNRHYLVVTVQPKTTRSLKTRFRKQQQSANKAQLDDLCLLIENSLAEFGIRLLQNTLVPQSELLSFWASILNGCYTPVRYYRRHLSDRLIRHSITFDKNGTFRLEDGSRTTYGAILSLQTWG